MIILDTDICIEYLRGNPKIVSELEKQRDELAISFMSLSELYFGAYNSRNSKYHLQKVRTLAEILTIIDSNPTIAKRFGYLKAGLKNIGKLIPDADIMIASCAIENSQFLVTGNVSHFDRLLKFGLNITNWFES